VDLHEPLDLTLEDHPDVNPVLMPDRYANPLIAAFAAPGTEKSESQGGQPNG
jgi:hypothetical protein